MKHITVAIFLKDNSMKHIIDYEIFIRLLNDIILWYKNQTRSAERCRKNVPLARKPGAPVMRIVLSPRNWTQLDSILKQIILSQLKTNRQNLIVLGDLKLSELRLLYIETRKHWDPYYCLSYLQFLHRPTYPLITENIGCNFNY